jgi:CBS domain containing-hemolysin-like protein
MALSVVLLGNVITHKSNRPYTVNDLEVLQIPCVSGSMSLVKLISQFRIGKTKVAVVLDENDNVTPVGIITSEDVFAALITIQLEDEYDLLLEQRRAENIILKKSDSQNLSFSVDPKTLNSDYMRKQSISESKKSHKKIDYHKSQSSPGIPPVQNLKEILARRSRPGSEAVFPPTISQSLTPPFKDDNL